MNPAGGAIDVGVVIERVRVRVQPCEPLTPREQRGSRRAPAGDHRIVIGELRVDTEAALEPYEARRLGDQVARALTERLTAIQERRLAAILARRSRGGAVHVGALRIVLRGAEAARPNLNGVSIALADAVERSLGS